MRQRGNWDKVNRERQKKYSYSRQEQIVDYSKIVLIIIAGYIFFHFIVMGWHL
jgi:hypothetical protein